MNKKSVVLLKVIICIITAAAMIFAAFFVCRAVFPIKYGTQIREACTNNNTDIYLVLALIKAESNFNQNAVSRAGAKGIMQLTEETFSHCCKKLNSENADILSPEDNINAGVWYLSYLLDKYNGSVTNAVAAYNAGSSNVDKWLKDESLSKDGIEPYIIPFGETKRHVQKTKRYIRIYKLLYPNAAEG